VLGQDTHYHLTAPIVPSEVHDEKAQSHAVGINECGLDNTSVPDDGDRLSNIGAACQLHIKKPDHLRGLYGTLPLPTSHKKLGTHYHSCIYPQYTDRRNSLHI
jgi:hypothetical protein